MAAKGTVAFDTILPGRKSIGAGGAGRNKRTAFDEYVSDPNRPVPYVGTSQMG